VAGFPGEKEKGKRSDARVRKGGEVIATLVEEEKSGFPGKGPREGGVLPQMGGGKAKKRLHFTGKRGKKATVLHGTQKEKKKTKPKVNLFGKGKRGALLTF